MRLVYSIHSIDMDDERFRKLVEEAWHNVPAHFASQIKNVALLIEEVPSEVVRESEGLLGEDTLLGLYQGIARTERGSDYGVGGTLPDTITLFRLPLLKEAQTLQELHALSEEEALRLAIAETLWHEVGHYFGLTEEEIQAREEEGTNAFMGK